MRTSNPWNGKDFPHDGSPPFTENREFWVLMGYAVALGVFGAFAGLVFMGVIGLGGRWYVDAEPGLVRRAVVVGGGHGWRPVSSSDYCAA